MLALRPGPSASADINFFSKFFTTAYEAMNYTTVCMSKDAEFIARTGGPRGNPMSYAEHVKYER